MAYAEFKPLGTTHLWKNVPDWEFYLLRLVFWVMEVKLGSISHFYQPHLLVIFFKWKVKSKEYTHGRKLQMTKVPGAKHGNGTLLHWVCMLLGGAQSVWLGVAAVLAHAHIFRCELLKLIHLVKPILVFSFSVVPSFLSLKFYLFIKKPKKTQLCNFGWKWCDSTSWHEKSNVA